MKKKNEKLLQGFEKKCNFIIVIMWYFKEEFRIMFAAAEKYPKFWT